MKLWLDFNSGISRLGPARKQIALIRYQRVKSLTGSHLNPHQEADAEFKSTRFRVLMKAGQQPDDMKEDGPQQERLLVHVNRKQRINLRILTAAVAAK